MFIFIDNILNEYSHYDQQKDKDFLLRHLFYKQSIEISFYHKWANYFIISSLNIFLSHVPLTMLLSKFPMILIFSILSSFIKT